MLPVSSAVSITSRYYIPTSRINLLRSSKTIAVHNSSTKATPPQRERSGTGGITGSGMLREVKVTGVEESTVMVYDVGSIT